MKKVFVLKSLRQIAVVAATVSLIFVAACSKKSEDPAPTTAPVLATVGATNITATSATVGGNITSNGGKDVTEAGVVMSILKPMPTVADEKKTSTTLTGAYTINLTGLTSGTTYFVRAYATNAVGTTYGESVILATGNLAPEAKTVTITGTASIDQKLTASYQYSDAENNAESGSTYKWYRANDANGGGEAAIDGATKIDYTLVTSDVSKFIRFGVTPKAAAGTSTGTEVKSAFTIAISAKVNEAPKAVITAVSGVGAVEEKLTVAYTYSDTENDAESSTKFKWYVANDASGAGEAEIAGETAATLTLKATQLAKFVRVGITPKAITGTQLGAEVKSTYTGPIGAELTTVTFTYNNNLVTYGIITSSVTQRKWLDRNLGAPNTPTAYGDFANAGDLFQWGRAADGHQLIIRGATNGTTSGVNGTTNVLSDAPTHNKFITNTVDPLDWRVTPNNSLWQGVNGINNPCPAGWRIPTFDELTAEQLTDNPDTNFDLLKMTWTGRRYSDDGSFAGVADRAYLWSSSTIGGYVKGLGLAPGNNPSTEFDERARASACRCIKE